MGRLGKKLLLKVIVIVIEDIWMGRLGKKLLLKVIVIVIEDIWMGALGKQGESVCSV